MSVCCADVVEGRAVEVDDEVDARSRSERGAFRLHVAYLPLPQLPTAVLRPDPRVSRQTGNSVSQSRL